MVHYFSVPQNPRTGIWTRYPTEEGLGPPLIKETNTKTLAKAVAVIKDEFCGWFGTRYELDDFPASSEALIGLIKKGKLQEPGTLKPNEVHAQVLAIRLYEL